MTERETTGAGAVWALRVIAAAQVVFVTTAWATAEDKSVGAAAPTVLVNLAVASAVVFFSIRLARGRSVAGALAFVALLLMLDVIGVAMTLGYGGDLLEMHPLPLTAKSCEVVATIVGLILVTRLWLSASNSRTRG